MKEKMKKIAPNDPNMEGLKKSLAELEVKRGDAAAKVRLAKSRAAGLGGNSIELYKCPFFEYVINKVQSGASGERLGWVDLDFGSSPGWWAATVATYCPIRMVEHPKSKSTKPRVG